MIQSVININGIIVLIKKGSFTEPFCVINLKSMDF